MMDLNQTNVDNTPRTTEAVNAMLNRHKQHYLFATQQGFNGSHRVSGDGCLWPHGAVARGGELD